MTINILYREYSLDWGRGNRNKRFIASLLFGGLIPSLISANSVGFCVAVNSIYSSMVHRKVISMTSKLTSHLCPFSATSLLKSLLPLPYWSHLYGSLVSSMQLACLSEGNHPHSFQRFHVTLFLSLRKGLGMHNQLHTICQSTETTMASLRFHQSWQLTVGQHASCPLLCSGRLPTPLF